MSSQSRVLRISEPATAEMGEKPKLDPSDPRIRKLVYSMYRDMLTNCNDKANEFISQKDPQLVRQDLGVGPILESIIRQGSSGSGGSSPNVQTAPAPPAAPAPPPPPPMMAAGSIPSVRLNSEVGPLQNKGPPRQIQGAMMKDKKPFTYTPGGIDLSEIKSPRMAKRIQMNAAAEGVTSVPTQPPCSSSSSGAPHYLPPAALAAMQPQMPISVFPQGGFNTGSLHRTFKPNDFTPDQEIHQQNKFQHPPPQNQFQHPPTQNQFQHPPTQNQFQPPPPLPPQRFSMPDEAVQPIRFVPIPPPLQTQNQYQQQQEPRATNTNVNAQTPPKLVSSVLNQSVRTAPGPQPQTKAQTVSQNIGSIYIPPLEPKQEQNTTATAITSDTCRSSSFDSETERDRSASNTPQTPQLNKAPTPWMNSHNRMQNQVQPSPPYVGNATTPWGTLNSGPGRTIPISIAKDDTEDEFDNAQRQVRQPQQSTGNRAIPFQIQMNNNVENIASGGTRTIPIQMEGGNIQRIPFQSGPSISQTPQSVGGSAPIRRLGPTPYNNPTNTCAQQSQPMHESYKQMHDLPSGMSRMTIVEDDGGRPEPTQSKSFRVLQKITDDESSQGQRVVNAPVTHTIKIRMPENISPVEHQQQQQKIIPASQQKVPEPKKYMGSNIPSRSFKMLQVMTGESDSLSGGTALGSDVGPEQMNISSSASDNSNCPTESFPNPETIPTPESFVDSEGNYLCVPPENWNYDPNFNWESWDAYTYWYYWWYYANYWNQNGNVNDYSYAAAENANANNVNVNVNASSSISIPSKSFRNLQKSVDDSVQNQSNEIPIPKDIFKIVVEGETRNEVVGGKNKEVNCDEFGLKKGETRDKGDWKVINKQNVETEGGRNDETEEESACECECYSNISSPCEIEGFVDEPETPSSEDDASTLTDESQPLMIEECFLEPESSFQNHIQNRLSTIDELSENEISFSPIINSKNFGGNIFSETDERESSSSESSDSEDDNSSASVIENKSGDLASELTTTTGNGNDEENSLESDEDIEVDENENLQQSTVTVRLPLTLSFTKSKSYRDIATVLVGDSEIETNGKLTSTGRNVSDIEVKRRAEILSIRETSEPSEDSSDSSSSLHNVPVTSFTITLTRSDSKNKEREDDKTKEKEVEKVEIDFQDETGDPQKKDAALEECQSKEIILSAEAENTKVVQVQANDDIDFWGEIINKSSEPRGLLKSEIESLTKAIEGAESDGESSVDFWQEIETEKNKPVEVENKHPDINFWEKQEILTNRFNFIESHRDFELTEDYHSERAKNMQLLISSESEENNDYNSHSLCQSPVYQDEAELLEQDKEKNGFENKIESESELIIMDKNSEDAELDKSGDEEDNRDDEAIKIETAGKRNENEGDKRTEVEIDDGNNCSRCPPENEGRNLSSKDRKASNVFRPTEFPISLSVSDETSDESSSRSSGTTIGKQEKSGSESDRSKKIKRVCSIENKEGLKENTRNEQSQSPPQIRQVQIKQINENLDSLCTHHHTTIDRVGRAESLLWRIERFLQESLCLGSEDDSGFMTDLSRPISECETDYDAENDIAIAAAAQKRNRGCTICSETRISEEKVSTGKITETLTKTNEEKVTLRSTSAGRKALSYQRAKTHSRLFQLLQDECGREDEDEEEVEEFEEESMNELHSGIEKSVPIEIQTSVEENENVNSTLASRSHLMTPLPITTNFPACNSNTNSTSSPSGSSGILSPTSPAHRDQLLADIINEFHLRVTNDSSQKTNFGRKVNFPSKIFKLLQEEFGEEFYDTFHSGDFLQISLPMPLNAHPNNTNSNTELQVQECTHHKSESVTKTEKQSHICHKKNFSKSKSSVQETTTANNSTKVDIPTKI